MQIRGQITAMREMFRNLSIGLAVAILVIVLLLAANFESARMSVIVLSTAPAVLAGVVLTLWITGTTLSVNSAMGVIMMIGIVVSNGVLLVDFANVLRRRGKPGQPGRDH